jgi:DnaJ family protein C protein 2
MSIIVPLAPFTNSLTTTTVAKPATFTTLFFETAGRTFTTRILGERVIEEKKTNTNSNTKGLNLNDKYWDDFRNKIIDLNDYYALLDLSKTNVDSTEEEIRKAYRTLSLVCHPDKASNANRKYAEDRFKAMQTGYEILIDPARRRAYDSSIDFDDRIPSDKEGKKETDFFKVYGPVFLRNGRFSQIKPVPQLGDINTPDDTVHAFYDFWLDFKSWREFSYLDEQKINESMGREEKRHAVRENQKKQASRKKEETLRVRKLVEDAMKKDPRIIRMQQREEEEKKKKKLQKKSAQQLRQEAEAKAKAEQLEKERLEKETKAKAEAAERDQKKLLKLTRSNFAKFARDNGYSEEIIEKFRNLLSFEVLQNIITIGKTDVAQAKSLLDAEITKENGPAGETETETSTHDIAAEEGEWSTEEQAALENALRTVSKDAPDRWGDIANLVKTKTKKQCVARFKHIRDILKNKSG